MLELLQLLYHDSWIKPMSTAADNLPHYHLANTRGVHAML
jgi:hypothetical protein